MSGWKSLAVLMGCAAMAGAAEAQTSLFDPPAANSGAAPLTPSAEPAAKPPARKAKPKGPAPARSLSVVNESGSALTALEVSGDGKTARLPKELPSGQTAILRLPALKGCTVTISATFQRAGEADMHEYDICKDRTVRFVN